MSTIRRISLAFVAFMALALVPAAGSAKQKPSTPYTMPPSGVSAPAPKATTPAKQHQVGDPLFIEWGGSWWKATTLAALNDGRVVIHYTGWGDEWDELAKPARVRTEIATASALSVNDSVFVEWKGSWWPAKITGIKGQDKFAIHYDNYGNEWDEVVSATRITRLSPPEG